MSSSSSFGTYLETRKMMRRADERATTSAGAVSEDVTASAAVSLGMVTQNRFPAPIWELLKNSGLTFAQFAEAMAAIERAGLIDVHQTGSEEIVALTPKGEQFQGATRAS